jgi:hypothetical protein
MKEDDLLLLLLLLLLLPVQISSRRQAEVIRGFPQSLQANALVP